MQALDIKRIGSRTLQIRTSVANGSTNQWAVPPLPNTPV
jgi:hypothetical protein